MGVSIRIGNKSDIERVRDFYTNCGYSGSIQSNDVLLIAEEKSVVVGVVRLCIEYGYCILRGMRVHDNYRRKGIGKQMLFLLEELLCEKECYCLPYRHLINFYGNIGFVQIAEKDAPKHLQQRLNEYKAKGLNITVMKREPKNPKAETEQVNGRERETATYISKAVYSSR